MSVTTTTKRSVRSGNAGGTPATAPVTALDRAGIKPIENYLNLGEAEIYDRIQEAKKKLGDRVVILGHHYQRDDVICHADLTGDSFKLSQMASERSNADYIVFCGVHFMAESADVLSADHQQVILPDLAAGCSMADMARLDQVESAWEQLQELGLTSLMPITYMNSAANIKAFCGRHEGVVCTSSNAVPLFDWALKRCEKLFFFPDEHLGRNTGIKFGIPLDQMVVWEHRRAIEKRADHLVEGLLLGSRAFSGASRGRSPR
jgi:quinolinate synthase